MTIFAVITKTVTIRIEVENEAAMLQTGDLMRARLLGALPKKKLGLAKVLSVTVDPTTRYG